MLARSSPEVVPLLDEASFDNLIASERTRLVRLCAHLTGNPTVAEDLAQETLLEAWRNQHKLASQDLVDPLKRMKWLTAIARNICLRWGRSYGRELTHLAHDTLSATDDGEQGLNLDELPAGDTSLDIELERGELAQLLDRALALLPPTTRAVLIERYLHESPHAEIAERLGLNEDALVQRLYRGKLALRRVLEDELNAEAASYGLVNVREEDASPTEQSTRIWCPLCNTHRLIKYYDPATDETSFVCPGHQQITGVVQPQHWEGLQSPKSILNRQLTYLNVFYWRAINQGTFNCQRCGRLTTIRVLKAQDRLEMSDHQHTADDDYGVAFYCDACKFAHINPLSLLTIDVPESQQFWRQHSRMSWLPAREIDYAGQPALLSGFQSASDSARLDIVYQRSTLKILGIHETTS